ncbi:hypothetical protein D5086_003474 [Populus alba]|uniref:Uncharacterized protein n=1 Tax=Populus alba TaxID=43335 RepID=A0ACC4D591_POPAL
MTALKYACVSFLVLLCFSFSIAHKFLFDTNDQKLGDFRHGSSHVGGAGKRYGVWWRIEWRLVLPGDLLLNYGYGIGRGDGGSGHSTVPGIEPWIPYEAHESIIVTSEPWGPPKAHEPFVAATKPWSPREAHESTASMEPRSP